MTTGSSWMWCPHVTYAAHGSGRPAQSVLATSVGVFVPVVQRTQVTSQSKEVLCEKPSILPVTVWVRSDYRSGFRLVAPRTPLSGKHKMVVIESGG